MIEQVDAFLIPEPFHVSWFAPSLLGTKWSNVSPWHCLCGSFSIHFAGYCVGPLNLQIHVFQFWDHYFISNCLPSVFSFLSETPSVHCWNPRTRNMKKNTVIHHNFQNQTGGLILPDLKTNYKATIIKTVWHWHRTDIQTNETEWRVQK